MRWKTVLILLILTLAAGFADFDYASAPAVAPAQAAPVRVTISSVRVSGSRDVQFAGHSTLPDGAAIDTQLYGDGVALEWWPAGQPAIVQDGRWEIHIVAARIGDALPLNPDVAYVLHAWANDDPATVSAPFPFDLAGPLPPPAQPL